MLDQLPYILVPFLISFFQVATSALALGLIPALWIIARCRHYGLLWRWGLFTLVCIAAAVYGLPKAYDSWKIYTGKWHQPVGGWMGYFVSILFAPMLIPEPLRIARRRVRHERPTEHMRRRRRQPK